MMMRQQEREYVRYRWECRMEWMISLVQFWYLWLFSDVVYITFISADYTLFWCISLSRQIINNEHVFYMYGDHIQEWICFSYRKYWFIVSSVVTSSRNHFMFFCWHHCYFLMKWVFVYCTRIKSTACTISMGGQDIKGQYWRFLVSCIFSTE